MLPSEQRDTKDGERVVFNHCYEYDEVGRITRADEGRREAIRYYYNEQDHLTGASGEALKTDPAGNCLPEHSDLDQLIDNRLPFWGDRHYTYDSYGNVTEIKRGQDQALVQRLIYNAKHQLVELIETRHGQFEQKLTFQYDPFGRRIWKKVYTTAHPNEHDYDYAEEYIWQGNKRIQTRHFDNRRRCVNNEITIYRPGTHVPLAIIDNTLGILDIDTDHLGTPKAMYDHNTGNEVWSISHEVYGKSRVNQILAPHLNQPLHPKTGRPLDPKIRFQGQYEDLETGLYQNLHRYYDPNCGRYLTPDPIGLMGGLNAYQYCPNPVSYIDPLGLSCKEVTNKINSQHLDLVTSHPNAHSITRHGGAVTDSQLLHRALTGVAPDGHVKVKPNGQVVLPPMSSAFYSDELLVAADQTVRNSAVFKRKASELLPEETFITVKASDIGDLGMDLGRGYKRIAGSRYKPELQGSPIKVESLRSVQATYELNSQTNVWESITIFPAEL